MLAAGPWKNPARISYAGASKDISRLPAADGLVHDPDAVAMRAFRTADLQAGGGAIRRRCHPPLVRQPQASTASARPRTVTAFINAVLPQQPE